MSKMMMPKNAMVLAAGLGTRMRPLTDDCPKPLLNVAGVPLINYVLGRFAQAGVEHAVVNTHFLAEMIEDHLQDYNDLKITLSQEHEQRFETGGALIKAKDALGEAPIFCTNTDAILLDAEHFNSCQALAHAWQDDKMDALLLLCPLANATGYDGNGDFILKADGTIAWPHSDANNTYEKFIFTGLQIIHPRLYQDEPLRKVSTKAFWDKAMENDRIYGVLHDGLWMHVGDPKGLKEAQAILNEAD